MSQEKLKNNVLCENLHNHNVLRSWEGGGMAPLALSPRSSYNCYSTTSTNISHPLIITLYVTRLPARTVFVTRFIIIDFVTHFDSHHYDYTDNCPCVPLYLLTNFTNHLHAAVTHSLIHFCINKINVKSSLSTILHGRILSEVKGHT